MRSGSRRSAVLTCGGVRARVQGVRAGSEAARTAKRQHWGAMPPRRAALDPTGKWLDSRGASQKARRRVCWRRRLVACRMRQCVSSSQHATAINTHLTRMSIMGSVSVSCQSPGCAGMRCVGEARRRPRERPEAASSGAGSLVYARTARRCYGVRARLCNRACALGKRARSLTSK